MAEDLDMTITYEPGEDGRIVATILGSLPLMARARAAAPDRYCVK